MSFNAAPARATLALLGLLVLPAAGPAGSEEPGHPPLTAIQSRTLWRALAARRIDEAAARLSWPDLPQEAAPLLVRESRPGMEPFVLLVGHPSPPAELRPLGGQEGEEAAIGARLEIEGVRSPVRVAGVPTAIHDLGDTWPRAAAGEPPAELEILAMVHQLAHVRFAAAGGERFAHHDPPPPGAATPEVIALSALESRILAEALFLPPAAGTPRVSGLAGQLLAVRAARAAQPGAPGPAYGAVETAEGIALYTEMEALRLIAARQINAPPPGEAEGAYDTFRFAIVWRLDKVFGRLLETPEAPSHVAARAEPAGAALAIVMDRLRIDWKGALFGDADATLGGLFSRQLPQEAREAEENLRRARQGFGYEAHLAAARERAAAPRR